MLRSISVLVLALSFAACGGIHIPGPPSPSPTPPPETPSPVCLAGHGDPGEHYSCWHYPNRTGWVYACPVLNASGQVVGIVNKPSPDLCEGPPQPAPSDCLVPSGGALFASDCTAADSEFTGNLAQCAADPSHPERCAVKQVTGMLGDRSVPPGTSAEETDARSIENLKALSAGLRSGGLCAFAGDEAVFIRRDDGRWDEVHAVYFGSASWTNSGQGAYVGCHTGTGTVPPASVEPGTPTPTPPTPPAPDTACGEPDPRGRPGEFGLSKHNNNGLWDSTYRVYRDYNYCVEAGFVNRGSCPVRLEGSPQRLACEALVIGKQRWFCDGKEIPAKEGNPAQAVCIGHVRTETEDGKTWAEADW